MSEPLLTDELRRAMSRETPPISGEVTAAEIKRFAYATDDLNPLYLEEAYAVEAGLGGIVAPPLFVVVPTRNDLPLFELGEDGNSKSPTRREWAAKFPRVLAGGTEFEFFDYVRPGDVLAATRRTVDMYEKQGRTGPMVFVISETAWRDQQDRLVATMRVTAIYRPPEGA